MACAESQCLQPWTVTGHTFSCADLASGTASPAALVGAFTTPAVPLLGQLNDAVVTVQLVGSAVPLLSPPTPTPTVGPQPCIGACHVSDTVGAEDLLTLLSIALGSASNADCQNGSGSGAVTVDVLLRAVNHGVSGCTSPPL